VSLAERLTDTWHRQGEVGFLLTDPGDEAIEIRTALDRLSGVTFRFRWLPHREVRSDVAELERRGILNPDRDAVPLFCDPRDPSGRHCFLCIENIAVCHPLEELVPMELAGRDYVAGANFAWIGNDHYTVMPIDHIDQDFTPHVLDAMVDLHRQTEGRYRVLYNGADAGATIPWHLHYQITTDAMPIEQLVPGHERAYPTAIRRYVDADGAAAWVDEWLARDPDHHRLNILVAGAAGEPTIHVFPRDSRKTHAEEKGLIGGFEVCGDLVYSEPETRAKFDSASAELARRVIGEVRPDDV
jgi:Domain of unknown function (DUF4922)